MRCFCQFYRYRQSHLACLRSVRRRAALHRSARHSPPRFNIMLNSTAMEYGKERETLQLSPIC
jgi:hypothetical protein